MAIYEVVFRPQGLVVYYDDRTVVRGTHQRINGVLTLTGFTSTQLVELQTFFANADTSSKNADPRLGLASVQTATTATTALSVAAGATIGDGIVPSAAGNDLGSLVLPFDVPSFWNIRKSAIQAVATTTLTTDLHLTTTFKEHHAYAFRFILHIDTGAAAEGIKVSYAGTFENMDMYSSIRIISHAATPVITMGVMDDLGQTVGQTIADAGSATVEIEGAVDVGSGGTFSLQWAKNASTGATSTSMRRNSLLMIENIKQS